MAVVRRFAWKVWGDAREQCDRFWSMGCGGGAKELFCCFVWYFDA